MRITISVFHIRVRGIEEGWFFQELVIKRWSWCWYWKVQWLVNKMLCDDVWSLQFYNLKLITRCLGSDRAANIIIILTSRTKSPLMYKLMEDKNCVRVRLDSSWLTTSSQRLSFEPRPVKNDFTRSCCRLCYHHYCEIWKMFWGSSYEYKP